MIDNNRLLDLDSIKTLTDKKDTGRLVVIPSEVIHIKNYSGRCNSCDSVLFYEEDIPIFYLGKQEVGVATWASIDAVFCPYCNARILYFNFPYPINVTDQFSKLNMENNK